MSPRVLRQTVACVSAGDNERAFAGAECDVQGTDALAGLLQMIGAGFRVGIAAAAVEFAEKQERMAGFHKADAAFRRREADQAAADVSGEETLGAKKIEHSEEAEGRLCVLKFAVQKARQKFQHLVFAIPFLTLQFLDLIVDFHQEHGLEVAGFPRLGPVVDNALKASLIRSLEGQDVAVGGQGHEFVLQVRQDVVILRKGTHFPEAGLMQAP